MFKILIIDWAYLKFFVNRFRDRNVFELFSLYTVYNHVRTVAWIVYETHLRKVSFELLKCKFLYVLHKKIYDQIFDNPLFVPPS